MIWNSFVTAVDQATEGRKEEKEKLEKRGKSALSVTKHFTKMRIVSFLAHIYPGMNKV